MINLADVDYHLLDAHRRRLYEDADRQAARRKRYEFPYRSARDIRRKR